MGIHVLGNTTVPEVDCDAREGPRGEQDLSPKKRKHWLGEMCVPNFGLSSRGAQMAVWFVHESSGKESKSSLI